MSNAERILEILNEAPCPLPGDELCRRAGIRNISDMNMDVLEMNGLVRRRRCPDDRLYVEWWLASREKEMEFWLSI